MNRPMYVTDWNGTLATVTSNDPGLRADIPNFVALVARQLASGSEMIWYRLPQTNRKISYKDLFGKRN